MRNNIVSFIFSHIENISWWLKRLDIQIQDLRLLVRFHNLQTNPLEWYRLSHERWNLKLKIRMNSSEFRSLEIPSIETRTVVSQPTQSKSQ